MNVWKTLKTEQKQKTHLGLFQLSRFHRSLGKAVKNKNPLKKKTEAESYKYIHVVVIVNLVCYFFFFVFLFLPPKPTLYRFRLLCLDWNFDKEQRRWVGEAYDALLLFFFQRAIAAFPSRLRPASICRRRPHLHSGQFFSVPKHLFRVSFFINLLKIWFFITMLKKSADWVRVDWISGSIVQRGFADKSGDSIVRFGGHWE